MSERIAVIGAGPIGLEAATLAARLGGDVIVYERGTVAENVRRWGHVRLFSPFAMNASEWGRAVLTESGVELPDDEEVLSGHAFANRYLSRLVDALGDRVRTETEVVAVGRPRHGKSDAIGRDERAEHGFRLLVRDASGERDETADVVLDCSGVYPHHRFLGPGGLPCPGERALADRIDYELPDVLGHARSEYAGRRTLVVGSGYSAATTVTALATLAESAPGTSVVWITRGDRSEPIARIADDALPNRDELAAAANRLATTDDNGVDWRSGAVVEAIRLTEDNRLRIDSSDGEPLLVDRIVANVGYKPDRSLYEELQVHECYASQGPMKLAAALLGQSSDDCLSQTAPGPETLRNPEPNFFVLGAKSYGRDSRFLMRIGHEQVRDVMTLIGIGSPEPALQEARS